jgi:hypothetical protein
MAKAIVSPKAAPERPAETLSKKRSAHMRPPLGLRPPGGLMCALQVAWFCSAVWPDFTPPLTFADIPAKSDNDLMPLIEQLIKQRTQHWSADMVADPVQERLLQLIAEKKKARKKPAKKKLEAAATAPDTGKVVNIMDALRKSLEGDRRAGR